MLNIHMITTKGYTVSGCTRSVSPQGRVYISGRLRIDKDDPSKDQMLRWDEKGQALSHEFGALINDPKKKRQSVGEITGFNLFSCLYGGA